MTPDLAARRVIVAAYLYYVLDSPTMPDGDYDALSQLVADQWDALHTDRQWALGSPDEIRASGAHIRFSCYAVCAARLHYLQHFKRQPTAPFPTVWKHADGIGRYVTTMEAN